jgi:hypothetical protein
MSATSEAAKVPREQRRRVPGALCSGVVAAILAFACGGGSSSLGLSTMGPSALPGCDGEAPSYHADVMPLLEHYCFECHSKGGDAAEDHDFSNYTVLHAQRRALSAELEAGAMPPPDHAQPSRSERALLARWACSGAPEN